MGRHILAFILTITALLTSYMAADAEPARGEIPRAARKYLPQVVREAHYRNLDPVNLAGQIHQESLWNPAARSAHAGGLAQFTPEAEAWIKGVFARDLGGNEGAASPKWAIRAAAAYDRWLLDRTDQGWPLALRAYNGGLGYIIKERGARCLFQAPLAGDSPQSVPRAGDAPYTPASSLACCRRFRTGKSCTENLAYPEMILTHWAPMYRAVINPFAEGNS